MSSEFVRRVKSKSFISILIIVVHNTVYYPFYCVFKGLKGLLINVGT